MAGRNREEHIRTTAQVDIPVVRIQCRSRAPASTAGAGNSGQIGQRHIAAGTRTLACDALICG
jgi:hypothetical protein